MYQDYYLANPHNLGENRLPARSLLLPAQKTGITHKNPADSDRITMLNGTWRFSYRTEDTDEAFYEPAYDDSAWNDLPVPSMWQYHGYGSCLYPNVRYPFPYDPPYVHIENPVGLYRRAFSAKKKENGHTILRFGGVDNACFVWLNGVYVGFSKGSRIAAEFDVTDLVRDGDNLLAVKVYTFSDASYLENQDMLLASGIFRDVMLIETGENALWDYTLLPDDRGFTVKYEAVCGAHPARLRVTLFDASGALCGQQEQELADKGELFLPLSNPVKWNAEAPYLYTLYFEVIQDGRAVEVHTKKAGIAHSEISGSRLLMNGTPITLKGVNRHENNAFTGRAITKEQIEAELRDIKACGLNAIRCAHYTNQPVFYEWASELGIYVMDEADCETHGAEASGSQGALNKDPEWFDAFFDRTQRMYAQDKNETCIHIWSLGNECGKGDNHKQCSAWLHKQEVKKIVRDSYTFEDDPTIDASGAFSQIGYMPMQKLYDSPTNAPLLLLEYAHAMGNSPGGLEDIWNWIYTHDHCCGGYVWEYKSHGFYTPGKNGRPRYLYGGDFPGDVYHWSNFSLDGYHRSDGTPKPSWAELCEVSAPVFVQWKENGVEVKNTYDFTALDGFVMHWSVRQNGNTVREGDVPLDGIAPRETRSIPLPLDSAGLTGLVTADCEFFRKNEKIAHKQTILTETPVPQSAPCAFPHTVERSKDRITVTGEDFTAVFDKGLLTKLVKNGEAVLDAPMRLNCWRATTDNDGIIGLYSRLAGEWTRQYLPYMLFGCHSVTVHDAPEEATICAQGNFLPRCHRNVWGFETTLTYHVAAGGCITVEASLTPYSFKATSGEVMPAVLPRVGMVLTLPGDYTRCSWFGRGPGENYADCKANAPIGLYESTVENMNFLYDVPQETGNHQDCRRVTVFGKNHSLTAEGAFCFSLHDMTLENLTAARHADELEKSEKKYLYLDAKHRGLGSNSCGPQPEKEYELPAEPLSWKFTIFPG